LREKDLIPKKNKTKQNKKAEISAVYNVLEGEKKRNISIQKGTESR